ncbi:MAG: sigma 54-interacting transcriptional regulator [Bacteroidota bacterium]
MDIKSKRQYVNKLLADFVSSSSESFMNLSAQLKSNPEQVKILDKIFSKIIDHNKMLGSEFASLIEELEKSDREKERINEEKKRLEKLYASGILFQSETDMKSLMEKAIDTVVNELDADEGFIVLLNDKMEVERIVAKNMDPVKDPTAKELSSTILNETIKKIKPLKVDDIKSDEEYSKHSSIISLGLTAAISVPLILNGNIIGVVSIDRRNKEAAFKESDLAFLISFAKQITRGIQVSNEITNLEEKLEERPKQEFQKLRELFKSENIIGSSKKVFNILKLAHQVAASDASILILGENGTGKDVLAKAIHENSLRKQKPFVAVNCSAIPSDLLESELFGYESGAFTGAVKSKPGKLETADGGTVFLDEIGEMSINLQAKLLRVIQTKEIERLGSIDSKKIDVRFIAATNRDISKMISGKTFREDLYYRLKVIEIKIPPLSDRREDIEELVNHFIKKFTNDGKPRTITNEALQILENYNWPGNIRELENVIHRSIILGKTDVITIEDLPGEIVERGEEEIIENGLTLSEAEDKFRRIYLTRIIRSAGSKSEAAKILGINRSHLHKLLTQLELSI